MRNYLEFLISLGKRTENGCLEWPYARDRQGYGKVYFKKKVLCIHRVIAHLAHGLDLFDYKIKALHKCNNPPCFEPSHIKLGSQSLNLFQAHLQKRRENWKSVPRDLKGRFAKNVD